MGLLRQIVRGVLMIIVAGAVLGLLWWLIGYLGLPEPFGKVANGVLAIGGVFVLIAIILELAGVPLIDLTRKPPE